MKKKGKLFISLSLVIVLMFGSVCSVSAAKITCPKFTKGSVGDISFEYTYIQNGKEMGPYSRGSSFEIISGDNIRLLGVFYQEDDYYSFVPFLVSDGPFSVSQTKIFDGESSGPFTNSSSQTGDYYYFGLTGVTIGFELILKSCSFPYIYADQYVLDFANNKAELFEKMFLADFTWSDGSGPDLSDGFVSSLGCLSGLEAITDTYNTPTVNITPYLKCDYTRHITWSNNHSDWDSSYKVALYRRATIVDDNLFANDEVVAQSDLYYVGSVDFDSCSFSYKASQSGNDYFIDYCSDYPESGYHAEYDDYLIIYRETDEGTQYGYWNVIGIQSNKVNTGKSDVFGIIDSDGNFSEVGDLDVDRKFGYGTSEDEASDNRWTDDSTEDGQSMWDAFLNAFTNFGNIFGKLGDYVSSLFSTVGSVPTYVAQLFSFLPAQIISCISLGILIVIVLRFLGR